MKNSYSCSLELVNDILGGKWKLRILYHIYKGDNRFSLLRKAIPDMSHKVLITELRKLQQTSFINRIIESEKPLIVRYEIADNQELISIINTLCEFGRNYAKANKIELM